MAPNRVNIRFVVMLAVVLIMLAGGVMVAGYYALKKSGDQYAALGDTKAVAGDYEKAAEYYAKAVHKNQANAEWCRKWAGALEQTTPKPRAAYFDRFSTDYQAALMGWSEAAPADVAVQKKRMEVLYRRWRGSDMNALEYLIKQSEVVYKRVPQGTAGRDALLKYRGLARVNVMRLVGTERPKEELQQGHDDLALALAADPADRETAMGLADWCLIMGAKMRDSGDAAGAERMNQEARSVLQSSIAASPPGSGPRLLLLRIDLADTVRAAAHPPTVTELYSANRAGFMEIVSAVKDEKPEELQADVVGMLCQYLRYVPGMELPGVVEVLESLIQKRPADAGLRLLLAYYELANQHTDRAAKIYADITAMPDLKLSIPGLILFDQRINARRGQVAGALAEWELAKTPEAKAGAIKKAEAFRKELADDAGQAEEALLFIDARIAYVKGDSIGARTALVKYNEKTSNSDNEALAMLAELMVQQQSLGEAIKQYKLVLERDHTNMRALLALGNLEARSQEYAASVGYYQSVLDLSPGNQQAKDEIEKVKDLALGAKDATNPVLRALMQAQETANSAGGDIEGASGILRSAIAAQDDVRLHLMLARLRMLGNDRPGAKGVVETALQKYPDNGQLKELAGILSEEDPEKAVVKAIQSQGEVTDLQKQLQLYVAYSRLSKPEKAKEALDKAVALDTDKDAPVSAAVLDFRFQNALSKKEYDDAAKLAEEAAARNADHAQGLTFKARLDISQQKLAAGAASLEKALEMDKLNAPVWRLLGNARLAMGQVERAAEAFEKALALKPDDLPSIIGEVKALGSARKFGEALAFARKNQPRIGADPEFVELWLMLESVAPAGDRAKALETRRQLARKDPGNEQNNVQLIGLLADNQQFDEAAAMIAAARKTKDSLRYVQMDSQLKMTRGDPDGALRVYSDYIALLPEDKRGIDPYLSEASLLAGFGQGEKAIAVLEEGRKFQDPKMAQADRSIGDLLFGLARYDDAVVAYDKVLKAAGEDPGLLITKRIVDSLNRGARYTQAKQRLDGLGASIVDNDPGLVMLRAESLAGLNDRAAAKAYFDRGVAMAKDDPLSYTRRAEFLAMDPQRMGDAESDYRQAISMQPRLQAARERLARLMAQNARWNDAIEVVKQGVALDPDNGSLRATLITIYLDRGMGDEAAAAVRQGVERQPDDIRWLLKAGETMSKLNRWPEAAEYAAKIWAKSKSPDTAMLYLDTLLRQQKPDTAKAAAVLADPSLKIEESSALLMSRARLLLKQGKNAEAGKDMAGAMAKINPAVPAEVSAFFGGLEVVFPEPADRLSALAQLKPADGWKGWFRFFAANLKSGQPATSSEGLKEIHELAEKDADPQMRRLALSVLGSRSHADHRADEALDYWTKALAIDPNDPDLNNNVAYTLATDMNDPEKARPYAEKAAEKMPNAAAVLDTLGTVYMALKDIPRADNMLLRAAAAAGDVERPAILLHVAQLRIVQKNKADAQKYVRLLEDLMSKDKKTREEYTQQVADLKKKVEAL